VVLTSAVIAVIHVLAAAAWFGAIFYSHMFLYHRARAYFPAAADFEDFTTAISHGARRPVIAALGVVALSGVALLLLARGSHSSAWWAFISAKAVLFLAIIGLFAYISWRMWPARVFATARELPGTQRRFRRVAWLMLVLAGLSMALGVAAHIL
jgi:uncharacterized membrane protein